MKRINNENLIFTALCTAITVIFSQIIMPLPFTPISMSLSILAVFISGGILPVKWAVLSQIIYVFLGILGLPVFAGFNGGLGVLVGPTGGFILGYVFTAFISSFLINKFNNSKLIVFPAMSLGLLACYICGTLWFMIYSNASFKVALISCVLPFVVGDIIKMFIASTITLKLRNYIPNLNV